MFTRDNITVSILTIQKHIIRLIKFFTYFSLLTNIKIYVNLIIYLIKLTKHNQLTVSQSHMPIYRVMSAVQTY